MRTLWEFHKHPTFFWRIGHLLMQMLLRSFDHIAFSTRFQEQIYEWHYGRLPQHSVLENAVDVADVTVEPRASTLHTPVRLLFMGRFVAFKNLASLVEAMKQLPDATLTLVGDGPLASTLRSKVEALSLESQIKFLPPARGAEKDRIFREHDLFVLPSLTEISPNVALEAQAAGLPVLLTSETGLSEAMRTGMVLRRLRTPDDITAAVRDVVVLPPVADLQRQNRDWDRVTADWIDQCRSVLS